jgi:non-specific serine/threonine protein kinase
MPGSLTLRLTPERHLVLEATDEEPAAAPEVASRVAAAFSRGTAAGVLHLGAKEIDALLPVSLQFWRGVGRAFMAAVCAMPDLEAARASVTITFDPAPLVQLREAAPPMPGGEYLDVAVLERVWDELAKELRAQLAAFTGPAEDFLHRLAPVWNSLGRVYLHLAENKRDAAHPFAFLATYTAGFSSRDRVQHTPLGDALRAYAGKRDRAALERLLAPVRRAADRSPLIHELLQTEQLFHPLAWTPAEAHRFLKELHLLEGTGLLLRLPDWWKARPRPVVQVSVGRRPPSQLGLTALLDFDVGLAIGDTSLTEAETRALLRSAGGLLLLKGRWVEVDSTRIQEALDHWRTAERAARAEGIPFGEAMRLMAGLRLGEQRENEVHADAAREWTSVVAGPWLREALADLTRSGSRSLTPGAKLEATLRPYQIDGVAWLGALYKLQLGACLADDMGLGKTIQVIGYWLGLKGRGERGPHLLVAPASLLANWRAELARFGPSLSVLVAHPSELAADELARFPDRHLAGADVVLTTYGQLHRLPWASTVEWSTAVLDEAQNIKNPSSKQTRAVKGLRARARVALTGTPVENRLGDLWSLFDFLNPGLLGSAKSFGRLTKAMIKDGPEAYAPLRRLVRPYLLRRLKTDPAVISDLPAKTEMRAYCGLTPMQAELYAQAVRDLSAALDNLTGMERRGTVLAFLMRFKQLCNHPAQWLGTGAYAPEQSGKFARLRELCEELSERQEKVLVFTQFKEMVAPLARFLAGVFGRDGVTLDGGTPLKERKARVERFQCDDAVPFFVLSVKAGGTGLNLTAASQVIHFDRWWNPAVENQATDRAFRIGQKRNVIVHKFVCRGTVEDRIDQLIESKRALADQLVEGGGEVLLTEMDDAALLRLVSLDLARASAEG